MARRNEYDEQNVYELKLCIDNDATLYRQQFIPIVQNLMRKRAKGVYDSAKAAKLFGYLADNGAKRCAPFYGDPRTPWHAQFPVADRRRVAKELEETFRVEADLGNYDAYLPKGSKRRR